MKTMSVLLPVMLMAGCVSAGEPASKAVGMANPASVYCAKIGGSLAIESRAEGQVGICTLPDGSKIEEWELFRRDHPQK